MGVVRRGRTRNASDWDVRLRHWVKAALFAVVICGGAIYFPYWLYHTEVLRRETFHAFAEAEEVVVPLPGDSPPGIPRPDRRDIGKLVLLTSDNLKPMEPLQPTGFDFQVDRAMRLRWTPQYCQWDEVERCSEECSGGGGGDGDESCDTICEYTYVKGWHYHRISSVTFDQPAAHYNPQRDPLPPHTDTAAEYRAGAFTLTHAVMENLDRFRPLSWTFGAIPKPESEYWFPQRWWRAFLRSTFGWEYVHVHN